MMGSVETKPSGRTPARTFITWVGPARSALPTSGSEPGARLLSLNSTRKVAPSMSALRRSWRSGARASQGLAPLAVRAATTAPADVPTSSSEPAGSQPVSATRPWSAPISQDVPRTPPPPGTRPTLTPTRAATNQRGGWSSRRRAGPALLDLQVLPHALQRGRHEPERHRLVSLQCPKLRCAGDQRADRRLGDNRAHGGPAIEHAGHTEEPVGPNGLVAFAPDDQVDLPLEEDPEGIVVVVFLNQDLPRPNPGLVQVGGDGRELAPGHVFEERHPGELCGPRVVAVVGQSVKELGHVAAPPSPGGGKMMTHTGSPLALIGSWCAVLVDDAARLHKRSVQRVSHD